MSISTTIYVLYQAAYKEQESRLQETVISQARLMEEIVRHQLQHDPEMSEGSAEEIISSLLKSAHSRYRGFSSTSEFTLAKLEGKQIHFLLKDRTFKRDLKLGESPAFTMGGDYAAPMQLALSGKSGVIVARDYSGTLVLAAYEPVDLLNFGIVAKVNIDEIRHPFMVAILVSIAVSLFLIILSAFGFYQVMAPMIQKIIASEHHAVRANKAKDEFLASMSHELRTPLTIIIGNSELLSESGLNQNQREYVQIVMSASHNLLSLVNDILDLSKMESGKFEVDLAPFDLTELLDQLKGMYALQAKDIGVHFEIQQKEFPQFQLWGDFTRIGQILLNLLSNAFKFTDQGNITLVCWREGELLLFSVEDSGIGMSADVLDRLFQPFEQADSSISRRYGGTGLGLHISWSLATLLDGSIEVTSEQGKGSQFILKLPYKESELRALATDRKQSETQGSSASHQYSGEVLVVEDTPELQLLERRILKSMGATVTLAKNGREAVEKATQQHFDLILMDMQMPVMNGLEATRLLRELGVQIPIAALTANVMQRHRDQFHEAGVDDFLQKPINKSELQQTLNKYLKLDHISLEDSVAITASSPLEEPLCSKSSLCPILVIDDEESVLELYQKVLGGGGGKEPYGGALQALEEVVSGDHELTEQTNSESSVKVFSVTVANQGKRGIDLAQQALQENRPFPVAFIDMRMPPGMDGLETAKALRALDNRINIVIVTAYSNTSLQQINEVLGHQVFYIRKPFDRQEVQQMARTLSQNWKKEHHEIIRESANPMNLKLPAEKVPSSADDEVDDELISIFIESATKNKQLLIHALAKEDWIKIKETAHTIKGSGSSFGFPLLTEKAKLVCDAYDHEQLEQLPELTMDLILEIGNVIY
ncbi:MAG TPA: response regulator [Gammaproteobacteria bacterium]|nr:response regulator [Gammaproteobacteria bacterium]MBT4300148.1 response regulator [Gammaproteobacteria bacterium]MBT4549000.1 response regulator [Gammaproteobacteria bacterium]MBT5687427.1 response regulator [Gammaproteobacteria bacterium]MBT6651841.1 response regulator [Gammaproteobacteria bacterium]